MAYYVGAANSLSDLRSALVAALADNGWSPDGDIYSKDGTYVTLTIGNANDESGVPANGRLILRVGNGTDGAVLTDAMAVGPRIGPLKSGETYNTWAWPVSYHIHCLDDPNEVYLQVNYNGNLWQSLHFGRSPSVGNNGTGNWGFATIPRIGRTDVYRTVSSFTIDPAGSAVGSYYGAMIPPLPFFWSSAKDNSYACYLNAQIHGAIDPDGDSVWSDDNNPMGGSFPSPVRVGAGATLAPLLSTQPNSWNLEATLLPVQIFQTRLENKISLVGELGHCRFLRNDYLPDGEVITLGADRWKVYSGHRRDVSQRNGTFQGAVNHSGTFAIAIRYDGP